MFVGVGLYSFTIGNLTSVLQSLDMSKEYNGDLALVNELTAQIKMPDLVVKDLRNYVQYNILRNPFWSAQSKKLINSLPPNLRSFLVLVVSGQLLCRISFF
jgi:hypothetical protein